MTPSLSFRIIRKIFRITGMRQMLAMSPEEYVKKAEKVNSKRKFRMPTDKKNTYIRHAVGGFPLLEIHPEHKNHDRALLLIYGGGMTTAPDGGDLGFAVKMGKNTGRDVFFPYYPLCPEHSVAELTEMVLRCYRGMLKKYAPENIAIFGFSSGGATAISTCLMINAKKLSVPMPGKLVAVSPGSVPDREEIRQAMLAIDERDFVCPASYMMNVDAFMKGPEGSDVPQYLLSPYTGDFTNFPETWLYYGGDEVLSAVAPYYEDAFKRYGVKYHLTVEPYMCHCYADFRFTPECRKANDEILGILKE